MFIMSKFCYSFFRLFRILIKGTLKNNSFLFLNLLYFSWFLAIFFEGGCKKLTPIIPAGDSNIPITSYLKDQPNLSLFNLALQRLKLDTLGNVSGNIYTYFVPTDSAMIHSGFTQDSIQKIDLSVLDSIIRYHIVPGGVISDRISTFYTENEFSTTSSDVKAKVYIEKNGFGFYINGISVLKADISLSGGVVHYLSRVLTPPKDSLLQTLKRYPELSRVYYSIKNNPLSDQNVNIQQYFKNSYTFMVPTNLALKEIGFKVIDGTIGAFGQTPILDFLLPHLLLSSDDNKTYNVSYISNQLFFSSDFKGNYIWPFLMNYTEGTNTTTQSRFIIPNLTTFSADGLSYKGANMPDFLLFVQADIVTYNGILHIINKIPY